MSMQTFTRSALVALALPLLLSGCASAPRQPADSGSAAQIPDSNEPDLLAQLRARMAAGKIQRKERRQEPAAVAAQSDTSSAPTVTVDPAKQQAALAVAVDYARSLELMKSGNDAEALALLQQISDKTPQFSGPLVNQAVILLRQEKPAEAEQRLRAALKVNPKSPFAHNLLGIALRAQGQFAAARGAYETALTQDPNYAKAHFNLGVLADLYLQDLPLALNHYERYQALQSTPDPAVANWIVDLQKRTGTWKPPAPAPAPAAPAVESEATAEAEPAPVGDSAPAGDADLAQQEKTAS